MAFLVERRKVTNLVSRLAAFDNPVWSFDEAVNVDPGVGRQRGDQADVRTFRGLDRTDTPIVGRVNVA